MLKYSTINKGEIFLEGSKGVILIAELSLHRRGN